MVYLLQACFSRGLNAKDIDQEELEDYLKLWTSLSKHVDGNIYVPCV